VLLDADPAILLERGSNVRVTELASIGIAARSFYQQKAATGAERYHW